MSLKYKIFIIFSLLTLFFLVVDYAIQRRLILPTYLELEESEAKQNLQRAFESIQSEIQHIDILCHDWSAWDDTYDYVLSRSQDYEESNLIAETFISNRLNLIYICDKKGDIVWKGIFDSEKRKQIYMPDLLKSSGVRAFLLRSGEGKEALKDLSAKGIVNTVHGPMLIVSRPILTSNNEGPSRGVIIMGKFLTPQLITKLTEQTRVNFKIIQLHDKKRQPPLDLLSRITSGTPDPYHLEPINGEEIAAYYIVPDIENNPALIINLTFPREISKQGIRTIHFALIYILIVGTIVLILLLFFTNSMVLKPLSQLTRLTQKVEATGDFSIRSSITGKDEIGLLSQGFNRMMEKTQVQTMELAAAMNEQKKEIIKRKNAEKKLRIANSKLKELASKDPLTALANRRCFEEVMQKEWKRAVREQTPTAVIICDIDYFKAYNDTYGHQQGDECLKEVASAIAGAIRRPMDIAARYGGEEFIALLPNTDTDGAFHVAEAMRRNIERLKITHAGSSVSSHVSISLGIAGGTPTRNSTCETLIEMADNALYRSKDEGRNRSTRALDGLVPSQTIKTL